MISDGSKRRSEEAEIRPPTNLTDEEVANIAEAFTNADVTPEQIAKIGSTRRSKQ